MDDIIEFIGNIAAATGIMLCVVAGVCRIVGQYYVFSFEAEALFISGTGLMVMACLAKLQKLSK